MELLSASLEKIKYRDSLREKLPYSTNEADWENFKKARNAVRQYLNTARANYVQNNLEENLNEPGIFWAELKKLNAWKEI